MSSWKRQAQNAPANEAELRRGQVWKTRNGSRDRSAFLIGDIREVPNGNGIVRTRVYGALITGVDGCLSHERDLDADSMRKMFKVLAFDPEVAAPDPDDGK